MSQNKQLYAQKEECMTELKRMSHMIESSRGTLDNFSRENSDGETTLNNRSNSGARKNVNSSGGNSEGEQLGIIKSLMRQHDQQVDMITQSKAKIQEELSNLKYKHQSAIEQHHQQSREHKKQMQSLIEEYDDRIEALEKDIKKMRSEEEQLIEQNNFLKQQILDQADGFSNQGSPESHKSRVKIQKLSGVIHEIKETQEPHDESAGGTGSSGSEKQAAVANEDKIKQQLEELAQKQEKIEQLTSELESLRKEKQQEIDDLKRELDVPTTTVTDPSQNLEKELKKLKIQNENLKLSLQNIRE